MSFVATAIIGGAVIGGVGSMVAGNQQSKATEGAANTAANAQKQALSSQQKLEQPYINAGTTALPQLQTLLGLSGPGGTGAGSSAAEEQALQATPGYQFTLNQGLQAAQNSAAARGMLGSGNTLEALEQYGSGLADQTYQQAVGNAENVVGLGQAAAAGQAANIGNAAGNISGLLSNQGASQAGIDMNTIAGISNALGGAAGDATLAYT
ncbi:MAG: hypothetical protein ACRETK_13940, partial [Steroidobacteraceae bacterium]